MNPGSVALVRFPFSSLESTKKRPALLLSIVKHTDRVQLLTLAMITSRVDGLQLNGDVLLTDWEKANLLHPSLVRLSKVATLELELVERQLGRLTARDVEEVKRSFQRMFRFWL